jgi:hypothetical protein
MAGATIQLRVGSITLPTAAEAAVLYAHILGYYVDPALERLGF